MIEFTAPAQPFPLDATGALDPLGLATRLPALAFLPVLAAVLPGGLALYRRLTRRRLLQQGERRRTLAFFMANPGATVGEAAVALDVDYKTTLHHARVLEEFRLVRSRRDGRLVRYEADWAAVAAGGAVK